MDRCKFTNKSARSTGECLSLSSFRRAPSDFQYITKLLARHAGEGTAFKGDERS